MIPRDLLEYLFVLPQSNGRRASERGAAVGPVAARVPLRTDGWKLGGRSTERTWRLGFYQGFGRV